MIISQKIAVRLEPKEMELQDTLKINKSLKKELDELQRVCVGLFEENEQLKGKKVDLKVLLV